MGQVVTLPPRLGDDSFHHQVVTALLRARHLLGLDLRQFARRLSVTPERLAGWEAGREPLPAATLLQAASVAGVPVEVLLGRRPLVRRLERLERRLDELVTALSNPRLLARRLAHLLGGLPPLEDWQEKVGSMMTTR